MRSAPSDLACGPRGRQACGAASWWWLLLLVLLALSLSGVARAEPAGAVGTVLDSRSPANGDWVVVSSRGEVRWRALGGTLWHDVEAGQLVPAESEIGTGTDASLTLVVGGDRLVMAADSRLVLPARAQEQDHRLRHDHGRLRIDVEPRRGRAVEVRTPLLSLGIKGTSFEVAVDRRQNSVLVLDGVVAVTPPDARDSIDLGPRQGWRQPVAPGEAPVRLEMAELPAVADRAQPVRWHLPDTEPAGTTAAGWSMRPVGSAQAQSSDTVRDWDISREPVRDPRIGSRQTRWGGGWLDRWVDHETSLLTIVMIAGGGLLILVVPALALGQNLRAQWQNRPASKGRRRRSLTHG